MLRIEDKMLIPTRRSKDSFPYSHMRMRNVTPRSCLLLVNNLLTARFAFPTCLLCKNKKLVRQQTMKILQKKFVWTLAKY